MFRCFPNTQHTTHNTFVLSLSARLVDGLGAAGVPGAHVMMTVPNFYKLETSCYRLDGYNAFIDEPLDVRNGDLYLSDRPGLGVDLIRDYLEAHEVT